MIHRGTGAHRIEQNLITDLIRLRIRKTQSVDEGNFLKRSNVIFIELNLFRQSQFAVWKNSTIGFVSSSQSEGGESTIDRNGLSGDVVASFGCQVDNSSYHIIEVFKEKC